MSTERLPMRKTREILRQRLVLDRSHRAISDSVGVGVSTVGSMVRRAAAASLTWSETEALTDDQLEARLYPPSPMTGKRHRAVPDWAAVHVERRRPGVTLELLHMEYLQREPDGYRYSWFCHEYMEWAKRRNATMRQVHRAGEKLFVDYAGKKPSMWDPTTGERITVELFVGVLGASNYTYAEATRTQRGPDWIASHVRAFRFFGGVPEAVVPDQLRSGVSAPCRYEPGIQRTYEELARHYNTTVLPARPAHPRDKAKVEVAVQIAERWILARLRNETYYSLDAMNERIADLLEELNARTMRVYQTSRRALFEKVERPALRALPAESFTYGEWKVAKINIDYHVEVDGHYYSVPHSLMHDRDSAVEIRFTAVTVEVYKRGQRVASHRRSYTRGTHTTVVDHMPKSHQQHAQWTPSRIVSWAGTVGAETQRLVEAILAARAHPEQGYRSCLGIIRLGRVYGNDRLEAACARGVAIGVRSYRQVESILRHGLDRLPIPQTQPDPAKPPIDHENLRGPDYYN
jgi:transposase